jgi:hypothetical protein
MNLEIAVRAHAEASFTWTLHLSQIFKKCKATIHVLILALHNFRKLRIAWRCPLLQELLSDLFSAYPAHQIGSNQRSHPGPGRGPQLQLQGFNVHPPVQVLPRGFRLCPRWWGPGVFSDRLFCRARPSRRENLPSEVEPCR